MESHDESRIPGIRLWRAASGCRSEFIVQCIKAYMQCLSQFQAPKSSANHISPLCHHAPMKTLLDEVTQEWGGASSLVRASMKTGKQPLPWPLFLLAILLVFQEPFWTQCSVHQILTLQSRRAWYLALRPTRFLHKTVFECSESSTQ